MHQRRCHLEQLYHSFQEPLQISISHFSLRDLNLFFFLKCLIFHVLLGTSKRPMRRVIMAVVLTSIPNPTREGKARKERKQRKRKMIKRINLLPKLLLQKQKRRRQQSQWSQKCPKRNAGWSRTRWSLIWSKWSLEFFSQLDRKC